MTFCNRPLVERLDAEQAEQFVASPARIRDPLHEARTGSELRTGSNVILRG
jgi:hypothetical protein